MSAVTPDPSAAAATDSDREPLRLLLGGDLMLGRGIDQILPWSVDPAVDERWRGLDDARTFVELAVRKHGPLPESRDAAYVWGDVLPLFLDGPDVRLVNLETALSTSDAAWPNKHIRYRSHPANVQTLQRARIDCCALANNHVLDWGHPGLAETHETLTRAGIRPAGAGTNRREADAPARFDVPGKGRLAVFSFATRTSGVPRTWAAGPDHPGVALIGVSDRFLVHIAGLARMAKSDACVVAVSIHWGDNWGYAISTRRRRFARRLVDEAGVDLVHGHSAHHVQGIEVHNGKLILYGCGDLVDDYEGVPLYPHKHCARRGVMHYRFRPELGLLYHVEIDPETGSLRSLEMTPVRIRNLRVNHAAPAEARWLEDMLNREGRNFGTRVVQHNGRLRLLW